MSTCTLIFNIHRWLCLGIVCLVGLSRNTWHVSARVFACACHGSAVPGSRPTCSSPSAMMFALSVRVDVCACVRACLRLRPRSRPVVRAVASLQLVADLLAILGVLSKALVVHR